MTRKNVIVSKALPLEVKIKELIKHKIHKELLDDEQFVEKAYLVKFPPTSEERRKKLMLKWGSMRISNYFICSHQSQKRYYTSEKPRYLSSSWHMNLEDVQNADYSKNIAKDKVEELMKILPEREKKVIEAYFIYGYTEWEIAKMEGIDQSNVSRIKDKAIRLMKEYENNF